MRVNDLVNPLVISDMVIKVFKQSPSFGTQFSNINAASEGEKIDSDSFKQIYQMLLVPQAPGIGRYAGGMVGYGTRLYERRNLVFFASFRSRSCYARDRIATYTSTYEQTRS